MKLLQPSAMRSRIARAPALLFAAAVLVLTALPFVWPDTAVATCGSISASAGPVDMPRALDARLLSYVIKERSLRGGRHYRWKFWNADTHATETFLDLSGEPKLVVWDTGEACVYYTIGSHIFVAGYPDGHATPSHFADLPPTSRLAVTAEVMWKERATGRLRVILREAIPDDAIIKKPDGTLILRREHRRIAPAAGLPPWGDDALLTVLELGPGRKWVRIAQRETRDDAGDTPGLAVVRGFWHERGASEYAILKSYTCSAGPTCGEGLPNSLMPALRAAGNYKPASFNYIPGPRGLSGIIFRTEMGDTLHFENPLFLVSETGLKLIRPAKLPRYDSIGLGLGRYNRYLLVAGEYSGNNPVVIDLKTGRVVFRAKAIDAVWVPSAAPKARSN